MTSWRRASTCSPRRSGSLGPPSGEPTGPSPRANDDQASGAAARDRSSPARRTSIPSTPHERNEPLRNVQRVTRPRRSCLSVPGSSPKMLSKAPGLPADEVFMDLEDSVAPGAKEEARQNIVQALREGDWTGKTVVVRVNGVPTRWCYRDVIEIVENAAEYLDCLMVPKVEFASDVTFVHELLRQIEETLGLEKRIG